MYIIFNKRNFDVIDTLYAENIQEAEKKVRVPNNCTDEIGCTTVRLYAEAYADYKKKKDAEYNGWTNYATWRINMECVDAVNYEYNECGQDFESIGELADCIQKNTELLIGDEASWGNGTLSLAYDYAMAFLSDVNWYEIAKNMIEDNDKIKVNNK